LSGAGDLGRRVAERRTSLGLSREDLALRAAMSPTFVHYLETSPSPELSHEALRRLGTALACEVDVLTGGHMEEPPGGAVPSSGPLVEAMDASECLVTIRGGGIGRIVFCGERGPVAIPVNFRVVDGNVTFLIGRSSSFVAQHGDEASFEVDRIDEALSEGWSVLLTGPCRVGTGADEVRNARTSGIAPWAGGIHDAVVTVMPRLVTGRRIRRRSSLSQGDLRIDG
jgi:hypothetical protein